MKRPSNIVLHKFPLCRKMGLEVLRREGVSVVSQMDFRALCHAKGEAWANRFDELFGIQTISEHGLFASYIEAVLAKMERGESVGAYMDNG